MDILTDTEILDRWIDTHQKTQVIGCTDVPKGSMTYGEHIVYGEHTDVQGVLGVFGWKGIQMYGGL